MYFIPEDYKLTRRDFLRLIGEGVVVSQIPASLFASEDQWKKIREKIPAGKYDVLLYTFPGGGKEQRFFYVLDVEDGLKPEIYTPGVENLGSKSLDDVVSHIEKEKPYLKPHEVQVAPIKKGGNIFGYAIYYVPGFAASTPPYTESFSKGKYRLFPKSESESSGGGGGGGGGGCFTADTRVLMSDGSFKPIESISINEEVKSFDFKNDKIVNNKVTKLFKVQADSFLLINDGLKVTDKHPFAVGFDAWKQAAELKVGDNVLGNSFTKIKSIKRILKAVNVFNLSVNGTMNYFVSDGKELFLVHNKGSGGN